MSEHSDRKIVGASGRHRFIKVMAGEEWHFLAAGHWWDFFWRCSPNGCRNYLADICRIYPHVTDLPWFCLVGEVMNGADAPEVVRIGRRCSHTFETSGDLYLFANDMAGMGWNNWGRITVTAARSPNRPQRPRVRPWIVTWWLGFREFLLKSRGIWLVALLALGTPAVLALAPQGRDLVRSIADDPASGGAWWPQLMFALTLLILALQAWSWTRWIVVGSFGHRSGWEDRPYHRALVWAPRIVGVGPFLVAAMAVLRVSEEKWLNVAILLGLGTVFMLFVVFRPKHLSAWVGRTWRTMGLAAGVAMMVWATLSPTGFGWWFGPVGVVFLGVSLIIPVAALLVQAGARLHLPIVTGVLLCAVLFSGLNDNHAVRVIDCHDTATMNCEETLKAQRLDLKQAYDVWKDRQEAAADGSYTMVLLATEGGASRAGYWTAEVLAALHEASGGRLADRLFAISSVSGGSVGAVGYVAALDDAMRPDGDGIRDTLQRLTGADALSPAVAGMLFPDLLQRFLPAPLLPDRAQALERAWEQSWCGAPERCRKPNPLGEAFLSLGPTGTTWRPVVIVEGASEETGRRILTSKIKLAKHIDADDFYKTVGRDVPISTAIHNGARFPWISPAGTLVDPAGTPRGHILDGGYFDTAGLEVLRELAHALSIGPAKDQKLRFVFVFVGYDGKLTRGPKTDYLNEVLAPLYGLFQSRTAHGQHLVTRVSRVAEDPASGDCTTAATAPRFENRCSKYVDFQKITLFDDACGPGAPIAPPLDWALSDRVRQFMHRATGMGEDVCAPARDGNAADQAKARTSATANRTAIRHIACAIGAQDACAPVPAR